MKLLKTIVFLSISSSTVFSKVTPSLIESLLLVNYEQLSKTQSTTVPSRRASVSNEDFQILTDNNTDKINDLVSLGNDVTSGLNSSIPVIEDLSVSLQNIFTTQVSIEDLRTSVANASSVLGRYNLNTNQIASLLKTIFTSYIKASSDPINLENIVEIFYQETLPYSSEWNLNSANFIGSIAQMLTESVIENNLDNQAHILSKKLSSDLIKIFFEPEQYFSNSLHNNERSELQIADLSYYSNILNSSGLYTNIYPIQNRADSAEEMMYGGLSGFDPQKTKSFRSLSLGITNAFFNSKSNSNPDNRITSDDFDSFASYPNFISDSDTEATSVLDSFFTGLMETFHEISQDPDSSIPASDFSIFANHVLKSSSSGFLLASTVAATSNENLIESNLGSYAVETTAKGISASVLLNNILPSNEPNVENSFIFDPSRIVESVSAGAAMGSQLASVLPKSMDYSDSWEIFSNARKILAQAVATGSSGGAVDAMTSIYLEDPQSIQQIEQVTRSASLGSMMGNTGLAIYYPTDKLQSIIESSALGASYGATSNQKLDQVSEVKTGTEEVEVSLARESAQGSSLGAAFMQTVLLGDLNRIKLLNENSVDHFSSASFGATYGAILGVKDRSSINKENPDAIQTEDYEIEELITEISQSSKQGATEGAFAASRIALGLGLNSEKVDSSILGSKSKILKAINTSNSNALTDANSVLAAESLKVNPKDMQLLMKKYGINPKFTNAAKVYKKPVIVQVDEPKVDDNFTESVVAASPY